jgi:hypothetical protein
VQRVFYCNGICEQAQTTYVRRMEFGQFWLGYPFWLARIEKILVVESL